MLKDFSVFLLVIISAYTVGIALVIAGSDDWVQETPDNVVVNMYIQYTHNVVADGVYTNVEVSLDTNNVPLNAFEVEVFVDNPESEIVAIQPIGVLCEERFLFQNSIDEEKKHAHSICGSSIPFVAAGRLVPVMSIHVFTPGSGTPTVSLGDKTGFYIHDGFGTRAMVENIAAVGV